MIIKRHQKIPGLQPFVRSTRIVYAKQMRESFSIETGVGWLHVGKPRDWLVLVGNDLWVAMTDEQFQKIYRPLREGDCLGPCDRLKRKQP